MVKHTIIDLWQEFSIVLIGMFGLLLSWIALKRSKNTILVLKDLLYEFSLGLIIVFGIMLIWISLERSNFIAATLFAILIAWAYSQFIKSIRNGYSGETLIKRNPKALRKNFKIIKGGKK